MDVDTATRFITSLTKSLQAVIHGCLDFERDIELGGYVYLRVDNAQRVDYVLSEKMQKSGVNSMTFLSNSFHAIPQASPDQTRPSQHKDSGSASVVETAGKLAASGKTHTMPVEAESPRFSTSHSSSMPSHQRSASGSTKNSDSFLQPQAVGDNDEFQMVPNNLKWLAAATTTGSSKHSRSTAEVSRSNDRTQSLTDFQTAFRSPPTITSQSQQSPSLSHTFSFPQNGSSSRPSSGQPLHHQQHHQQQQQQQQQQQGKSGILPDASEMEVVHIKTEEEDEVFSIRLQCQQGGSEADGLTAQGKAPCLPLRMQQPFYFPYPRLARSQSWERHVNMAATGPKHPFFQAESGSDTLSLTCKICGKSYRSRQGLLFHERAKHQNVFNVYCPVCGKGFQQTTHMYGHMATHTNVKNFQCQACGAKYAHKTSLQQHLRSGSCRSSQISSPAGLDLSTSQILREFAPFNLCDAQSRPSPSSHSQSPLDTSSSQGHAETEGTLNQTQSPRFSHADLPSPDSINPSVSGEDRHDNLSDHAAGLNVTTGNQATSLKLSSRDQAGPNDMHLTSENHAMGVNLTGDDHRTDLNLTGDDHRTDLNLTRGDHRTDVNLTRGDHRTDVNLTRGDHRTDVNLTRGDHRTDVNLTRGDHRTDVNLTRGDHRTDVNLTRGHAAVGDQGRGLHTMCQDEAVGVDMTKESQAFGASRPALSVGDNTFDGQDAVYRHDCAPEAMPLSLSADSE